jgi:hypothetical protein
LSTEEWGYSSEVKQILSIHYVLGFIPITKGEEGRDGEREGGREVGRKEGRKDLHRETVPYSNCQCNY